MCLVTPRLRIDARSFEVIKDRERETNFLTMLEEFLLQLFFGFHVLLCFFFFCNSLCAVGGGRGRCSVYTYIFNFGILQKLPRR